MALWVFLLMVLAAVFVFVHAYLLPKLFLKVKYDYSTLPDRGLKVIDEEGGRSIVYEPDQSFVKYIKQYILSVRDKKKYFICKISDNIRYIDFDVVLFDNTGNSFKVLNVKELIKEKGVTRVLPLPERTVYVSLILNGVNDEKFENKNNKKVLSKGIAMNIVFGALVEIVSVILAKILIGKLFGDIYFESFMSKGSTWLFTVLICVALIAMNTLLTLATTLLKKDKKKGVESDA